MSNPETPTKKPQGFATMDQERVRELATLGGKAKAAKGFSHMDKETLRAISSAGGKAAHAQGRAHEFTTEEARAAGQKGGLKTSQNREHMRAIGRKGGAARSETLSQPLPEPSKTHTETPKLVRRNWPLKAV